jgi:hypothetical protein
MKIPTIVGTIDRRILINYRVDKSILQKILPQPFRPKLIGGDGVAGICLIRLKNIRPKGLPKHVGISSENGAHRIAVEWTENGVTSEGVYIPRRDTSSRLNSLAGGRIFPGIHHFAQFTIEEKGGSYSVSFISDDGTLLSIKAVETKDWNSASVFHDLGCASEFFQKGSVGYSPDKKGESFDGLQLKTENWKVTPLHVTDVQSSFFSDETIFPKGTIEFDNALLMKSIKHEWNSLDRLRQS